MATEQTTGKPALSLAGTGEGNVLLTGAAGVIGHALLEFLPAASTICLRHSREIGGGFPTVDGDLTEPGLGLSRATRDELAGDLSYVVHCAAITDFMAPREAIEQTNVEGTKRVLELAAAAEVPLLHVATAFVYHDPEAGRAPGEGESAIAKGIDSYLNSKRAAEAEVRGSGLPTVVVRPSVVIGDSRTGETVQFQGLQILTGLAATGRLPILPGSATDRIDFLPQDYVARALAALVERRQAEGDYWLTAGSGSLTLADAIAVAMEFAEDDGNPIEEPRIVDEDLMDRLIRPVFLPELPEKVAVQLETLFTAAGLGIRPYQFPSSLREMIEALDLPEPPDLRACYRLALDRWAESASRQRTRA